MGRFQPITRSTDYLFPPSINDWLPEQHLARFVVEIVEQLDLGEMERTYRGTGSLPFHPALLLSVLTYGEERARERFEQAQAEYQDKLAKREAKAAETGKAPTPPRQDAADKGQINLTDEASRIMKMPGGGFEQCYNAQLAVDMDSYLITHMNVVQAANDKQQVEAMFDGLEVKSNRLLASACDCGATPAAYHPPPSF